jgi:putative transposase
MSSSTRCGRGLAQRPEDWPWSSARTHLGLWRDGLTEAAPLLERVGDWRALLEGGLDERRLGAIRSSERTGHALGSERFLERLAGEVGREVRPRPRGRPKAN